MVKLCSLLGNRRLAKFVLGSLISVSLIASFQNCDGSYSQRSLGPAAGNDSDSPLVPRASMLVNGLASDQVGEYLPFALSAGQKIQWQTLSLLMQNEGNLVLYRDLGMPSQTFLWASGTSGPNGENCLSACRAIFDADGNLSLQKNGVPYWQSGTQGRAKSKLVLSPIPPFISIAGGGEIYWSSNYEIANAAMQDMLRKYWVGDSATGHIIPTFDGFSFHDFEPFTLKAGQTKKYGYYTLLMQHEGNLVLYLASGANAYASVVWKSGFSGPDEKSCDGKCRAVFQSEGNLVLYREDNRPYWYNTTESAVGNALRISGMEPHLSIVNGGRTLWAGENSPQGANGFRDPRGAPWERAQLSSAFRTMYLTSGDADFKRRFVADWSFYKSKFTREELTVCGSYDPNLNANVRANWASDDSGVTSIYYMWVYQLTKDEAALDYAKETIRCARKRWADPSDGGEARGGQFYDDSQSAKSVISSWLAVSSIMVYQAKPSSPDAAEFLNNAKRIVDWIENFSNANGHTRWAWNQGLSTLYWSDVCTAVGCVVGRISGYTDKNPDGSPVWYNPATLSPNAVPQGGAFYLGAEMGLNIAQMRIYQATADVEYLRRAERLARGIVEVYTDTNLAFKHDRDAWADAYLIYDWLYEVARMPGMPSQEARHAINHSTYLFYKNNRSAEGNYGPTWSGPADEKWLNGAEAQQMHVSANVVNMIAAGAMRVGPGELLFDPFTLQANQSIEVGNLKLLMQAEGNLVLYRNFDLPTREAIWFNSTSGPGGGDCKSACKAVLQYDGNLVLYHGATAYWHTNTYNQTGNKLRLSNSLPFLSIVNLVEGGTTHYQ